MAAGPRASRAGGGSRGEGRRPTGPDTGPGAGPDAEAAPDEVAAFLARLAGLLLRSSGEGAALVERTVRHTARALGADAAVLLVPDGATLTVATRSDSRTVILRGVPEVFRLDQVVALKPLVQDVRAGRTGVAEANRRPAAIETSRPPYPWWLKLLGIVLFTLGFAPLMQSTWYEVAATAVLGTVATVLAVTADRFPRFAPVLPLVVPTVVSVITVEVFARDTSHGGPVLLVLPALFSFVPGDCPSAAAAAVLAAAATRPGLRPGRPPRLVLLLPGFLTLTVGSLGMRGLTTLAGGYVIEGFRDLLELVTIVTAIAVGLVFGAVLAEPADAERRGTVPLRRT